MQYTPSFLWFMHSTTNYNSSNIGNGSHTSGSIGIYCMHGADEAAHVYSTQRVAVKLSVSIKAARIR